MPHLHHWAEGWSANSRLALLWRVAPGPSPQRTIKIKFALLRWAWAGGQGGKLSKTLFFMGNVMTIKFWKWNFYCGEILLSWRRLPHKSLHTCKIVLWIMLLASSHLQLHNKYSTDMVFACASCFPWQNHESGKKKAPKHKLLLSGWSWDDPGFVPGISPGLSRGFHWWKPGTNPGFLLILTQWTISPGLSQGQTRFVPGTIPGTKGGTESLCEKSLCAFFAR